MYDNNMWILMFLLLTTQQSSSSSQGSGATTSGLTGGSLNTALPLVVGSMGASATMTGFVGYASAKNVETDCTTVKRDIATELQVFALKHAGGLPDEKEFPALHALLHEFHLDQIPG